MQISTIKKIFILFLFQFIFPIIIFGATTEDNEPRYIVDMPTAGILSNMHYSINSQLLSNGGFLLDFTGSFFNWLNVGVSYGGNGVIGNQTMNLQKYPGLHVKARLLDEKESAPAIVLGFNSQGKGMYLHSQKRFEQQSPGFYGAISKSFKWALGEISVSGGLNFSIEDPDYRGINVYAGVEHSVWKLGSLVFEINPNLNDNNHAVWHNGNAFMLNGAIRIGVISNMILEIQLKDFLRNSLYSTEVNRYFGVEIISKF